MSRKPPKKSDMGKSWMKPRRDSRQMISPEYHLIVSEGTKTEPKYFEKIKETIDAKYRDRIHLDISGKGDNTVNLFNRAVKDVARSNNVYKHEQVVGSSPLPYRRGPAGKGRYRHGGIQTASRDYGQHGIAKEDICLLSGTNQAREGIPGPAKRRKAERSGSSCIRIAAVVCSFLIW